MKALEEQFVQYGPKAALFVGVVLAGLVASLLARRLARWLVLKTGLDALAEKAGAARLLYAVGSKQGVPQLVSMVVWYAGLLLTAAMAAEILGLSAVTDGVATIIAFLPRLLAALVVVMAGAALAALLRRTANQFARKREDIEQPEVLGNIVYYVVMTISVIVSAQQAGIQTDLLETLLTTVAGIGLAAIALAFALGSRYSFHNLVAGHFFRRLAQPGDRVWVGGVEGVIVRFFGVSVVLDTREGEIAVPCKRLLDENVRIERLGARARAQRAQAGDDGREADHGA